MSRARSFALVLSFAVVLAAPRIAHAGCTIECEAVRNTGVTITPALDCLVADGAPDDNSCVCASTQRFINNCDSNVEIALETPSTNCSFGCSPKVVAPGEKAFLDVYVPSNERTSGATYLAQATNRYVVTLASDEQKTKHVIEISAEADIDPEASACSMSPRPTRGSFHVSALGALGAAIVAGVRRVTNRRRH
jgi:hypothetical protein